jgi:hypothetical protein
MVSLKKIIRDYKFENAHFSFGDETNRELKFRIGAF